MRANIGHLQVREPDSEIIPTDCSQAFTRVPSGEGRKEEREAAGGGRVVAVGVGVAGVEVISSSSSSSSSSRLLLLRRLRPPTTPPPPPPAAAAAAAINISLGTTTTTTTRTMTTVTIAMALITGTCRDYSAHWDCYWLVPVGFLFAPGFRSTLGWPTKIRVLPLAYDHGLKISSDERLW